MSTITEPHVVIPPLGHVNLTRKTVPLCERDLFEDEAMAYTLGQVDVSAFKAHLLSHDEHIGTANDIWSDEYHDVHNVKLMRPAHDRWGIKKIVFTFCDDFLSKVLDLPFSQDNEWRKFIIPIYDAIGVDEKRIVRSLLAKMPPNVEIPVHHDTGYWVQYTHRVHVAICTDSAKVNFYVGKTEDDIRKYSFEEGRIVELNNQAKHAVNNQWDQERIHFIFDYVDDDFPLNRHILKKSEIVRQTRRSIDLVSEEGNREWPSWLIIGAQKSGTTSLYEYLNAHPLTARSSRRESHYFDWRWDKSLSEVDTAGHLANYRKYFHPLLAQYPSLMTGESTPSYLLHGTLVIPRLLRMCPWMPKIMIILRNPVDRAYSQYRMTTDTNGTAEQLEMRGYSTYGHKSFDEVVDEEVAYLQSKGVSPHAEYSYQQFQEQVMAHAPLSHGGHSIVARGLYALQVEQWLQEYTPHDQMKDNQGNNLIKVMSLGEIKSDGSSNARMKATLRDVFAFVGLPPHDLSDKDIEPKNTRGTQVPMSDTAREKLTQFYQPFNERLFQVIRRRLDEGEAKW